MRGRKGETKGGREGTREEGQDRGRKGGIEAGRAGSREERVCLRHKMHRVFISAGLSAGSVVRNYRMESCRALGRSKEEGGKRGKEFTTEDDSLLLRAVSRTDILTSLSLPLPLSPSHHTPFSLPSSTSISLLYHLLILPLKPSACKHTMNSYHLTTHSWPKVQGSLPPHSLLWWPLPAGDISWKNQRILSHADEILRADLIAFLCGFNEYS